MLANARRLRQLTEPMRRIVPQYPPPAPTGAKPAKPAVPKQAPAGVVSSADHAAGWAGMRQWLRSRMNLLSAGICAALLRAFAVLVSPAVLTKPAPFDEPLHTVVGHVIRHNSDYRMDPEDGAL